MIACMSAPSFFALATAAGREIGEEFVHRRHILRRLVFELVGGVVRVAEQGGAFGPQFRGPAHDFLIVEFAAVAVPRQRGLHDFFAERAVLQRSERRLAGRVQQSNGELPFLALRFRRRRRRRDFAFGKTRQVFAFIDDNRRRIFFLQYILLEFGLQLGELGIDLLQFRLVGVGELGARPDEILVVTLQEPFRFRVEIA